MSSPSWMIEPPSVRVTPVEPSGVQPELVDPSARTHLHELDGRAPAFVHEWRRTPGDAGDVVLRLFGAQVQPLVTRINRLPEKALVEFLRILGVEQLPGTTASALLAFEATTGAPQSAFVPAGFQVGATPADGSPGLVIFETTRAVNVSPGKIDKAAVQQNRMLLAIKSATDGTPFRPFGDRAIAGRAFLIGIKADVAPGPTLTLGLAVAAAPASPPPASAGGVQPAPIMRPPMLLWEVYNRGRFAPAAVIVDETSGFASSGIVELQMPADWKASTPPGADADAPLFWLRVRIVHGSYDRPPELSRVMLNAARAEAAETIRGEVLEHVTGADNRMRVARTPVIPETIALDIFEGSSTGDLDDESGDSSEERESGVRRWNEVVDLSAYGRMSRVFTLDPLSGELTFGDGQHGMTLPRGFRHVVANSYRVGGGRRGAVAADKISTLVHSAPFLRGATNPQRASGGSAQELPARAVLRGPEEIRARGRAVTERDYELLVRQARGAAIARARAVSGFHPLLPGAPIPGVVGVFVVPDVREEGPPVADEQTLRAVATFLADEVAAAGVEIVVSAARFHTIRAEVRLQVGDPAADVGQIVKKVIDALNGYFDPLEGGEDRQGWPFGGAIGYVALQRQLLARVAGLSAIPRINLVLDGVRFRSCVDIALSPYGLLWPAIHEVTVEVAEKPS
jgi:predicted phage baseplate assembly protein